MSTILNPVGVGVFGSTFDNVAAYGQATWHFAPTVRLVTGLRYTHDKVTSYDTRTDSLDGVAGPAGIGANFDANVAAAHSTTGAGFNGTPWTGEASANNISGKAAIEYDIARDHMLYASYSRGYKGPAFNTFFNMQWFNTAPISAETSNAFEAGLKNSFDHGRFIFNIDGFYTKVYNYQANYPTTVNGTVTTTIINAGDVSTRGGEAELLFRPNPHLIINGGYSYTDARVDRFLEPPAAQMINFIASGTPLAFAPKNKGNLGATYTAEPAGMPFALEFSGLAAYTDKQVSTLAPTNTAAQIVAFQDQILRPYTQVDISIAAVDLAKHYRLAFVVKNLFNDHYASTIGTGGPGGSYLYQIPRDSDRYWGVTLRYTF
jgi:iron complex outermembrane receptor protein